MATETSSFSQPLTPAQGGAGQIATVDQGVFVPTLGGLNHGFTPGAATINSTTTQVRAIQWVTPFQLVVAHITYEITTAAAAGKLFNVGVYNAAGTTLLLQLGAIAADAVAGIYTATITAVTLNPGVYWLAWATNDTTLALRIISGNTNFDALVMNNQTLKKSGNAANTATNAALPATLGVITAGNGNNVPLVAFER